VVSGAGAAALACLDLLVGLGAKRENIFVSDIKGVVYAGRVEYMDDQKAKYAQPTQARTLGEIIPGADLFLGLSAGGVLKPEMLAKMADRPLILALANPDPEISPEVPAELADSRTVATCEPAPNAGRHVLKTKSFRSAAWLSKLHHRTPLKLAPLGMSTCTWAKLSPPV